MMPNKHNNPPTNQDMQEEMNRGVQPDNGLNEDEEQNSEQIPEDHLSGRAYTGGWDEARENPESEALRDDRDEDPGTASEYKPK